MGCYNCLPGLGTTTSPSAPLLRCGRRLTAVVDGWVDDGDGGKEEATWQRLSHSCHIWVTGAEGRIYFTFVVYITKPL